MVLADSEKTWRFEGSEELGCCPFAFCFSSQAAIHIFTIVPVDFLFFCLNELSHLVPHDWVASEVEATPKEEQQVMHHRVAKVEQQEPGDDEQQQHR